jgi:hypothetical protein
MCNRCVSRTGVVGNEQSSDITIIIAKKVNSIDGWMVPASLSLQLRISRDY